jgi:hypothetical protein
MIGRINIMLAILGDLVSQKRTLNSDKESFQILFNYSEDFLIICKRLKQMKPK